MPARISRILPRVVGAEALLKTLHLSHCACVFLRLVLLALLRAAQDLDGPVW